MQIWNLKGTSVGSNGAGARGVIFVIDSADRSRAAEAKAAFKKIEADRTLKALPMLVIANKQDIPVSWSLSLCSLEGGHLMLMRFTDRYDSPGNLSVARPQFCDGPRFGMSPECIFETCITDGFST